MEKKRTLIFYKKYFDEFFSKLPEKVKGKIDEILYMIMILERIPGKFFSHMTGYEGLYEIRI
ncbi:MAG: type II toxin-antitoxin system RelE/ParE family toxin, partial [Cyclobacteriaceae bacterium]